MKEATKLVLRICLFLVIALWVSIMLVDFVRTKKEKKPLFCITKHTYQYEDGKTDECIGLGYKVYRYERKSITANEFGPIFIKQRVDTTGLK